MIAAILRAQWLSLRNARLGSGRLGRAVGLLAGTLWYGLWVALGVAAFVFASHSGNADPIRLALPRGLMLVVLYWQLAPVLTAAMGASLDIRRVRLFPVPEQKLFLIEVLLRLTTGMEMVLLMAGLLAGLSWNASFASLAGSAGRLALFFLFTVFNLLIAAGVRSLLERLLSRRLLREVLAVVAVCAAVLPQLALVSGTRLGGLRDFAFSAPWPAWPWSAAARIALSGGGMADWLILAGWTAAAWRFATWQFRRSLRYDFERPALAAAAPPAVSSWRDRLYRLPAAFFPEPLAAVLEKELRTLGRTPRFRTVFIMGFSFGLIVWLPLALRRSDHSGVAADFLALVCVYALALLGQVSYWNAFGFDRAAIQAYFVWPVGIRTVLLGKNLAVAVFILLETVAVTLTSLAFRIPIAPAKIAEAFLVTPVVALYLLAAGNLSSVHMPRAMTPDRVSHGGAPGRFQGLMFLVYPIALLPAGLAYLGRYAFSSQAAFYLLLAFAALLGAVVYWIAMDSAVQGACNRREQLIAELSRGEGPLAAN